MDLGAVAGDDTPPTDRIWCLTEGDIFRDLSAAETAAIAAAAPMKTYAAGEILYSPHSPVEALFVLKSGRVRIFRVAADGRELTTAILTPGTIFGEMVLTGQHMDDNFAEALDEATVWVMTRADVQRFLLADPRIAARITEILGARLVEMDSVFKTVPQRIAAALVTLAGPPRPVRAAGPRPAGRPHRRPGRGAGRHRPGDDDAGPRRRTRSAADRAPATRELRGLRRRGADPRRIRALATRARASTCIGEMSGVVGRQRLGVIGRIGAVCQAGDMFRGCRFLCS